MPTILPGKVRGGMGALPHESGVAFRVWAPHADSVYVTGSFNEWSPDAHPMAKEGDGYWYADVAKAAIGNEYRFRIVAGDKALLRIDPYARQVTSSVGNAVRLRLNGDWHGYSPGFGNQASSDAVAGTEQRDGFPAAGTISIGSYSALIFSQDKPSG